MGYQKHFGRFPAKTTSGKLIEVDLIQNHEEEFDEFMHMRLRPGLLEIRTAAGEPVRPIGRALFEVVTSGEVFGFLPFKPLDLVSGGKT